MSIFGSIVSLGSVSSSKKSSVANGSNSDSFGANNISVNATTKATANVDAKANVDAATNALLTAASNLNTTVRLG